MTKKLFVVLVLAIAVMASSFVIAANKKGPATDATEYTPPVPLYPGGGERLAIDKTIPAERLNLQPVEAGQIYMELLPGGSPQVPTDPKQDTCMVTMHSGAAFYYPEFSWVGDNHKEYQDPETSVPPCELPVYPFAVTELYFHVMDGGADPLQVIGYFDIEMANLSDPDCPTVGPVIYTSPVLQYDIPNGGHWKLGYDPESPICVNGPYFVSFHITGGYWYDMSPVSDNTPDPCRSYVNWGTGWLDFVVDVGAGGNFLLYSAGLSYADAHNVCPAEPECVFHWWHDGNPYWYYPAWAYFGTAAWFASPVSGYIGRARVLLDDTYYYGSPDLYVTLWDGNPTTGPGSIIDRILVPNSDFVFQPNFLEVDFTSLNVTVAPGDYIFLGVEPIDPVELVNDFAVLADYNGNGVETHSWFDDGTGWIDEYTAYGDYAEFMNELEFCGEEPCHPDSVVTLTDYGTPTWIWALPSTSGRDYPNQRFTLPFSYGGRLDKVKLAFYNKQGTPSPDVYVWMSDGAGHPLDANPPNNAMATYHIDNLNVVTYPSWQVVQTWEDGIYFDPGEEFHVGYSFDFSIVGDTLAHLSDDYTDPNNPPGRAGFLFPDPDGWLTIQEAYGIEMSFIMQAVICQTPPPAPTFVLTATPATAYISPGDADLKMYDVTVIQVAGYDQTVDLDIDPATLPTGITYNYVPVSGTPEFSSELSLSCAPGTPYASHTLTLRATGPDKLVVRTKDVTLIIQPPYDDALVEFYHGTQRMTNFGAVGDHDNSAQSFYWYGIANLLFDGTFIVATGPDKMALDFGRTHVHTGFIPTQHQEITYDDKWPANIGYAEFYTDPDIIDTEWDSLFIIGIMDSCVDFSIKIKIYYNPLGNPPIEDMYISLLEDWDFGDAYNNWGGLDYDHNLVWMYEPGNDDFVCGLFKAPFYGDPMLNMQVVHNAYITWPNEGYGLDQDSVWRLLTHVGPQEATYVGPDSQDYSVMITPPPITLNPGDKHIEIWIDFCRDLTEMTWEQWYHRVLRYAGFYRGDVDASDTLELPAMDISDLVYLINYLYKGGPAPLPFADQGDVDGQPFPKESNNPKNNVNLGDVVYLINYVYKGGPAPIDYVRFIPQYWSRPSLFEEPNW